MTYITGKLHLLMSYTAHREIEHTSILRRMIISDYVLNARIAFTPDHLMRLFEPAPGLVGVTGYNGRGITTGTVVGKAFAQYLASDNREALPLPFAPLHTLRTAGVRSLFYEVGFQLYHAGQCLKVNRVVLLDNNAALDNMVLSYF